MSDIKLEEQLKGFFSEELLSTGKRLKPVARSYKIRLDRNESTFEMPDRIKQEVLDELGGISWKNYPPPYYPELEELIATYNGVKKEQVVPGGGSANIITSVLNYFAINGRQIVLASPSFSLYEYHCNSYGIKYEQWMLNKNLEYAPELLPKLRPYSLVLLASPNNPVGNEIPRDMLVDLLKENPETMFLVDEVYNEFCEGDFIPLTDSYPNLLLLRSFSKTFSSAGLRVGYLIANESFAFNIRKLIIPFVLNYQAICYVKSVLSDKQALEAKQKNIEETVEERNRIFRLLWEIKQKNDKFDISPSSGNFLLIRFRALELFKGFSKQLEKEGVKLLEMPNHPILGNAVRMTIGTPEENISVLNVLEKSLAKLKMESSIM